MENQEIELTRFKRKARGYRAAHEGAPRARALEAFAIAGVLEGYLQRHRLRRAEMVIVDLMAGTGFLSECLHQAGFNNLHAFEACNEMSQSSSDQQSQSQHFKLHPFADVSGVAALLKKVRPHVIVCLAGFHHLIKYDADGRTVNIDESLAFQERMTTACMDALLEDGMFLIVDIYEDEFESALSEHWPYWKNAKTLRPLLDTSAVPESAKNALLKAESFRKFSSVAGSQLAVAAKGNPSLRWFRNVVDSLSSAGHKDIALKRQLINKLAEKYQVSAATTACPWVFSSQASLNSFLLTFWFDDFPRDNAKATGIFQQAESINGVYHNETFASFGWNLGFVAVEALGDTIAVARAARRRMSFLFWVLLAFCAVNICLKIFSYWSGVYGFLDNLVSVVLGAIVGEGVAEWQRRSEKQESKSRK